MKKIILATVFLIVVFSVFAEGDEMRLYHEQNCECKPLKNKRYLPYEWEHTVVGERDEFLVSVCSECGYKRILSQSEFTHLYAPYFGLSPDIKLISNPKTEDEFANNILYNWLIGNYEFSITSPYLNNDTTKVVGSLFSRLYIAYEELAGFYCAQKRSSSYSDNSLTITVQNPHIPEDKYYLLVLKGIDLGLGYKRYMHETGRVTEDMTETEIAKAYYTALFENPGKKQSELPQGYDTENNTVYSCLFLPNYKSIGYNSACSGRASTYNLLMKLEGITSQVVQVPSHAVNRIIADGQEYVVDWGQFKVFGTWQDLDTNMKKDNKDFHGYPQQGFYMLFDGTFYKKGFVTEDKNK